MRQDEPHRPRGLYPGPEGAGPSARASERLGLGDLGKDEIMRATLLLLIPMVVAACGEAGDDTTGGAAGPAESTTAATAAPGAGSTVSTEFTASSLTPETGAIAGGEVPLPSGGTVTQDLPADNPVAQALVGELAAQLGIAASEVTVRAARGVTWGDASLGCPMPGLAYTQALVDGAQVVMDVGSVRYDYRTDGGSRIVWCREGEPVPVGGARTGYKDG